MATIRDIAKITGYSISTISRVINNYPYVDDEKRQKVLQVMADLNYVPNRLAQNLSLGETKNIGVILPFVDHPFFDQLLSGIMNEAFAHTYRVTLLPTNYDAELEKEYLDSFAQKSFDGLIVCIRANHSQFFKNYLQYGPIVFCEDTPELDAPSAFIDLGDSVREALLYLKDNGVKKLGVMMGRSQRLSCNSLMLLKIFPEIFPNFNEKNIFWDSFTAPDGIKAAAFFQARKVDGILTNGDEVAAMLLEHYPGKKPLVIGRENLLVSQVMGFSTIDHHLKECGATAFQLFYNNQKDQIKIKHQFIKR